MSRASVHEPQDKTTGLRCWFQRCSTLCICLGRTLGHWPRNVLRQLKLWRKQLLLINNIIGFSEKPPLEKLRVTGVAASSLAFRRKPLVTILWQQSQERATKKMTRQHTDCFCLYTNPTKFIKTCFTYLCDKHTNTTYTGSHQHHEPSISCQILAGRVAHFLQNWEVLIQDQWVSNHGGIPTRTNNNPLPGPYVSHQMRCSPENEVQITTEVQELLTKG